ncbi:hypothetical protein LDENG_00236590 [Lucifuga dentata]|nr:hypothetical protein LDENG_00236590 [Lucifuga dentata]
MLALSRDPGLTSLGSAAVLSSTTAGEDDKHTGNHQRQQRREIQQQVSSQNRCFFGVETWPELREYEDTIEFQGKDGSFQVCVRAVITHHALKVPGFVQLPICAVQHSSRITFQLKNTSKLQVRFHWECAAPFQLIPEQDLLKPGQERSITAVFRPSWAQFYQQHAFCRFREKKKSENNYCTVLLQGLAMYPYLQLRILDSSEEKLRGCPVLHFGSVAVGCSVQKHFEIFNPSHVTASFSLSRLSGGIPLLGSEFSCNATSGTVGPHELLQATVSYTPAVVDTVSVEYLSLNYPGALNKSLLKLTGNCIGPKVFLSSPVVDFGCIKEGETVIQTVELFNSSPAGAVFQWDPDCSGHSVFSIQPAGGTVRPHSHITLKAIYRPTHPIAHHRRVACLILHKDPLLLDLIGTCHSELQSPSILRPEHLVLYHRLTENRSENLSAMQQEHKMKLDQQELPCPKDKQSNQETERFAVMTSTPMEEYYWSCSGGMDASFCSSVLSPGLTVEPTELHFNHKKSPSLPTSSTSSQSVSITNHTSRNLSLVWTAATDSPFSVSPSSCNLGPLKSTSFRVTYTPKQPNILDGAQLECFGYDKGHCHLTEPCPPLCVTVRVIGHSFQPGKEHFIPRCSMQPRQVVFPAVNVPSYQTVLLRNCGDRPLTFCLDPYQSPNSSLAASVCVVPSCALIQPGDHQILVLRATPTEDNPKQGFSLHLQLNAAKHTQEVTVISTVEKPCVSLEGDGSLYFQPTAVGSRTQSLKSIRNLSSIPLRFEWRIPEPDQDQIGVQPDAGELHPNESSIQTWSFSPQEETTYNIKAMLTFWPVQTPGRNKSHLTLEVLGMGSKGSIEAEIPVLDVGEILIGSHRLIEVPVVNKRFISSPPQALCEVLGKGVFPTLHVVDACSGGSVSGLSKVRLWSLFSLDAFNKNLLSAPSPAELTSKNPTGHSVHRSSTLTKAVLDFNFSAAPLHFDPSTFMLMFHNPGSIPVEWAFLFPEDQMEEFESLEESGVYSNTDQCQIKNHDKFIFSVSPHSGTLLPGQQRAVHFSYSHDFAGTDRLPVLFKLSHGRAIWLNFQGMTLEKDRPYLHSDSTLHIFTSVSIGNFSPPIQMYELYNCGSVSVCYKVDEAALIQQQLDNSNHPVLRCLNPEGEVLPGKTAMVKFVFSPLEAKKYHMDIPIHIHCGDSMLMRFEGCGLNSIELGPSNTFNFSNAQPSDCVKRVPFPGQMAFLSEDSISLGDFPMCYQPSRIVFLSNISHTDTVVFAWNLPQDKNQQVVQIHPERGRVCPGESALCVLTFTPSDYPTIYQLDLICQVTREAALIQYHKALQQREEERRAQQEAILTDDEWEHTSASVKGPLWRKNKTLPPIFARSSCEAGTTCPRLKRLIMGEQREEETQHRYPVPPQVALLHLGVTAHSHELMDYLRHFPNQLNKQYMYRCLQSFKTYRPETASCSEIHPFEQHPLTQGPARDILIQVLTSLLRSFLDDPTFAQSLISLASEPIPYFTQLRGTTSSHNSSLPSSPLIPPSPPSILSSPVCPTSSSPPPTPQHQALVSGTDSAVEQECDMMGSMEQKGWSESRPQIQNAPHTQLRTHNTEHTEKRQCSHTAQELSQLRTGNPAKTCRLADMGVHVLLNTLQNLMKEAVQGELDLTVHPRAIVLPPASASRRHKQT